MSDEKKESYEERVKWIQKIRTQRDAEWKEAIDKVVLDWRYACYEGACVPMVSEKDANELIDKLKSAMEAK